MSASFGRPHRCLCQTLCRNALLFVRTLLSTSAAWLHARAWSCRASGVLLMRCGSAHAVLINLENAFADFLAAQLVLSSPAQEPAADNEISVGTYQHVSQEQRDRQRGDGEYSNPNGRASLPAEFRSGRGHWTHVGATESPAAAFLPKSTVFVNWIWEQSAGHKGLITQLTDRLLWVKLSVVKARSVSRLAVSKKVSVSAHARRASVLFVKNVACVVVCLLHCRRKAITFRTLSVSMLCIRTRPAPHKWKCLLLQIRILYVSNFRPSLPLRLSF